MSGLHEVDCGGCGRRYEASVEQARKQRVLRCACGHFVRLDRALTELRSDPAPPVLAPVELASAVDEDDEDDEEQTHMLSSLAAVAALGGRARSRAAQPSVVEDDRASRPAPRSSLHSLPPAPPKAPSSPPPDKPLWYVDLGGSETVEMTIEQLIIARRSGKLGEGALVWREGMPRWRPVGTLIPAGSRPTPTPPAPSRPPAARTPSPPIPPPVPSRPPAPSAHGQLVSRSPVSYERPLATLEFALETASAQPIAAGTHTPLPGTERPSSRPPRAPTPIPRPATWSSPATAPTPLSEPAAPLAPVLLATPIPLPLAPPAALRASPLPVPRTAPRAVHPTPPPSSILDRLGDRPRWLSACIALLVCATASASGAYLVRSLKQRKQPAPAASSTAARASASARAASNEAERAPSAATRPLVVDLESLSVEHTHHAAARPASPATAKAPTPVQAAEPNQDSTDTAAAEAPAAPPAPAAKPKNSDLPRAARANPYTTGSIDDSAPKKTPTTGSEEPGF